MAWTRRGRRHEQRHQGDSNAGEPRTLADLDEDERYARFDRLQRGMAPAWDAMRLNQAGESVVVVPSVTVDRVGASSGSMTQAYEERFLFLLLLLRQPRLRMVYVTSMPVSRRSWSTTWRCCPA